MERANCETCAYFIQHYTFDNRRIFRIFCGHCTYSHRVKNVRPCSKACGNYLQAEAKNELFVSKEYLSKALLDYMLKLDLLPEIVSAELGDSSLRSE